MWIRLKGRKPKTSFKVCLSKVNANAISNSEAMSLSLQSERTLRVNPHNIGVLHGNCCIHIEEWAKYCIQSDSQIWTISVSTVWNFLIEYLILNILTLYDLLNKSNPFSNYHIFLIFSSLSTYIIRNIFLCRDNVRMEFLGNVVVHSHLWRWRHVISFAFLVWNKKLYDNDA